MDVSGQGFAGEATPQLWRWESRRWPKLFSNPRAVGFFDRLLCGAVRRLDASLRRRQGIIEFTDDPQCLLRLSLHRAQSDVWLLDRLVRRGDWIGELHLWNEHILPMTCGANMVWGLAMRRRLRQSLARLAAFIASDPRFVNVRVFRGEVAFGPGKDLDRTRCFASGFGFEVAPHPVATGPAGRLACLGKTMFLWGMIHTFNRGAYHSFARLAHPSWFNLWMTRDTLLRRYSKIPPTTRPAAREVACLGVGR